MATTKQKKAFVIRNISDAGSGNRYEKGAIVELDEGVFANYEAAGLVRAPTAADGKGKDTDPAPGAPAN